MADNHEFQDAFCSTSDAVTAMIAMFEGCTSRSLLLALTKAVCSVTRGNSVAQKMFVDGGACDYISAMMTLKVFSVFIIIIYHNMPAKTIKNTVNREGN